jgi:hypothetical protein
MLKVAVDRLIVPGMVRDMSAKHNDGKEDGEGTLEEDVMKTNAFGSTVADVSTRALFPLISVSLFSSFLNMIDRIGCIYA